MIWRWLFLNETQYSNVTGGLLPSWTGFLPLVAVCGIALLLLGWKIRPAQVVR